MYKIKTMNKISNEGLKLFGDLYEVDDKFEDEDAIIVRSAKLHDYDPPHNLKAIARAGAGVNNIPVDACSDKGNAARYLDLEGNASALPFKNSVAIFPVSPAS